MIKAEKIVRDILNDHCKHFHTLQIAGTGKFSLVFSIPYTGLNSVNMALLKSAADALNVSSVLGEQYDRGFRITFCNIDVRMKADVTTVEGVKATRNLTAGPVNCKTCKQEFTTLLDAIGHVELVHSGDVELDGTFDA